MKTKVKYLLFASALSLASCSGQDELSTDSGDILELTASVPELVIEDASRSNLEQGTVFSWEAGDRLGFIPEASLSHPESDRQSMFYIKDVSAGHFIGNGWGLLRGKRYYSYFPYSSDNSCTSVSVNYTGQTQLSNGGSEHLGDYDFLHSWIDMPSEGEAALSYRRIACVAKITITVPESCRSFKFTKVTLGSSESLFLSSGTYNPSQEYPVSGNNSQAETVTFATSEMSNSFVMNLGSGDGITCDDNGRLVLFLMMSPASWAKKSISLLLDGFTGAVSETFQLNGNITPSKNQVAGVCYNYSCTLPEPESVTDLSAGGSANCYIVTAAGKYRFRADIKGNGVAISNEGSSLAVPNCAYLVWESVNTTTAPERNSIISDVKYENGYVTFEVPDNSVSGNAMIALLNSAAVDSFSANGGKTIWVWHIWRLPEVPADNDYGGGIKFMDRNLGALNNAVGDGRAIGLLYQWGRPVPMLGAADYLSVSTETVARIVNNTDASGSTARIPIWSAEGPFALNDIFGSPMLYVSGKSGNRHWTTQYPLLLWSSSKTQYDPCPPGYKVPANFTGFSLDGTLTAQGAKIRYNGGTSYWWPVCGMRGLSFTRDLSNTGHDSTYWSSEVGYFSPVSDNVGYGLNFNLNSNNSVNTRSASYIITGNAVRCQKIQ